MNGKLSELLRSYGIEFTIPNGVLKRTTMDALLYRLRDKLSNNKDIKLILSYDYDDSDYYDRISEALELMKLKGLI